MVVRARGIEDLLGGSDWRMSLGERAAVEGVVTSLEPAVSVEIGTLRGGSLAAVSAHSAVVHSFDLSRDPSITPERFPNVDFHEGDSHTQLPETLEELARAGTNVDFALVDGDHSAAGVRQDLEDLLDSPAVGRTVILIHDTLNERVRAGLRDVDFRREKVTHVELDFVVGQLWDGGEFDHDLWGGLGLVVTGWDVVQPVRGGARPRYDAVDVFATFRRSVANGADAEAPRYGEIHRLEAQIADVRRSLRLMERSLSWRITAPLRSVRTLLRR
jgi:Methyltransferase domain